MALEQRLTNRLRNRHLSIFRLSLYLSSRSVRYCPLSGDVVDTFFPLASDCLSLATICSIGIRKFHSSWKVHGRNITTRNGTLHRNTEGYTSQRLCYGLLFVIHTMYHTFNVHE